MIEQWRKWKVNRYFKNSSFIKNKKEKKDILFITNGASQGERAIQKFLSSRKNLKVEIVSIISDKALLDSTKPLALEKGIALNMLKKPEVSHLLNTHFDYVISITKDINEDQEILLRHFPESIKIGNFNFESLYIDLNIVTSKGDREKELLSQIPNFVDQLKV